MHVALVISLVALFLVTATATVALQDRRARQQTAKHRRVQLVRLGEPTPQLTAHSGPHQKRWFGH